MHEAQMHQHNSFITLTYDDQHYRVGLDYTDFQRFMYRLRKRNGPTRFFAAGEYGKQTKRPHWHAILFGCAFTDLTQIGENLYRSELLEQLWPYGFSSTGNVTYASAAYVAKYATKKITGPNSAAHYERLDIRTGEIISVPPEMGRMSLRPGIGEAWLRKNWREVYEARDATVQPGGLHLRPPRYYDKKMLDIRADLIESKEVTRKQMQKPEDSTEQRLRDRELVALSRLRDKRTKL